jgi:polyisoprenoid-binding protein YceI
MSLRFLLVPIAAVLGFGAVGPRPFNIDRSHSEINFVAEAKLLDAHGFFDTFTVNVAFDPDTITNSTVQITIDPKYINTRNTRRDGHLKSCDFFCVDSFPLITYQSRSVTRVGPDRYRIEGDLTMRGVTKPVSVPARMVFNEPGSARFSGTFDVNRRDFGVNGQGGGGIINDSIHVSFNFSLRDPAMRRQGPPPPAGAPGAPPAGAPAAPPRGR